MRLAQPIETKREVWLRGVDLNHRPLGYEANRVNDSITFQRLDAAGNDTKSLKRHESTVIGPQSDYSRPRRPLLTGTNHNDAQQLLALFDASPAFISLVSSKRENDASNVSVRAKHIVDILNPQPAVREKVCKCRIARRVWRWPR